MNTFFDFADEGRVGEVGREVFEVKPHGLRLVLSITITLSPSSSLTVGI
jgi:hypothetical protein